MITITARINGDAVEVENLDISKSKDRADFVEKLCKGRQGIDPQRIDKALLGIADEVTEALEAKRIERAIIRFEPFPTDVLPEPIRGFIEDGSRAIGCDPAYLALPMLTAIATAIGNTRRIELKRGWSEPAIFWTAIVGESGTMKSPALELVMKPVRERQRKALAEHEERMNDYRDDVLRYERDLAEWKKKAKVHDPPKKPEEPVGVRYWCDDPTVEALAVLLRYQWRGLLMVRDELAGWMSGFDRYSQGKGGDVARWLEMFGGRPMVVDRKTGNPRMLSVPRAAVSVTGGIQPEVLQRCLGQQYRENGLAARLLLTCPPRIPKRWTESDIDPKAEAEIDALLDRLYSLQPTIDDDGEPEPAIIGLMPEAKRAWIEFYNQHAQEQSELSGDLSAAWSKLEGYAARLALVIHFARQAANDPSMESSHKVDRQSVNAGITLSRWFGHEARRVYARLSESDEERDQRRLVEWIGNKGGSVMAREVQQGPRQYRPAGKAEAALDELAKAGCGNWQDVPAGPQGGRPTRIFRLSATATATQPARTQDSGSFVAVASIDTLKSPPCDDLDEVHHDRGDCLDHVPEDEWGEL
jgi:hypothetical protein